uniref:Peptidase M12A domain-containing protein n=1 Tax=Haemonchus contortus TaxID=6289 RepID=A0A7I5EAC6_HAECO
MVPSRRGPGTVLVLLLFDIGLCLNEKGKSSFGKENFDADGTMAGDEVSIIKVNQKGDVEKYLFDGDILPAGFATTGNSLIPRYQNRYLRTMGGQAISFYDIHFINVHYQCYAPCSGISAKCVNGGVSNPRACSTNCICPAGYAGALCNQRAPAGKKIQIRVTALQGVNCINGCWVHAIEPKIDTDKRLTNARICCPEQLNNILPSRINPTPIVFYSIRRAATFTYQYRYVTQ